MRELGAATVDGLTDIPGPPDSDSRHRQRHATIGPDARDRTATHTSHDDTAARRRDFASNAGKFSSSPASACGALRGSSRHRSRHDAHGAWPDGQAAQAHPFALPRRLRKDHSLHLHLHLRVRVRARARACSLCVL